MALQTEEARAEAIQLMGSVNNLCTPKNGEIMISATQVGRGLCVYVRMRVCVHTLTVWTSRNASLSVP